MEETEYIRRTKLTVIQRLKNINGNKKLQYVIAELKLLKTTAFLNKKTKKRKNKLQKPLYFMSKKEQERQLKREGEWMKHRKRKKLIPHPSPPIFNKTKACQ